MVAGWEPAVKAGTIARGAEKAVPLFEALLAGRLLFNGALKGPVVKLHEVPDLRVLSQGLSLTWGTSSEVDPVNFCGPISPVPRQRGQPFFRLH